MAKQTVYHGYCLTKVGWLEITGDRQNVFSINFLKGRGLRKKSKSHPALSKFLKEIREYFNGTRKKFSFRFRQKGTDFQERVWNEIKKIPYGRVWSYKELARTVGNEKAARAVGTAAGQNKIPVVVPCHRVVGHRGDPGGYTGGVRIKAWLLKHEKTA